MCSVFYERAQLTLDTMMALTWFGVSFGLAGGVVSGWAWPSDDRGSGGLRGPVSFLKKDFIATTLLSRT